MFTSVLRSNVSLFRCFQEVTNLSFHPLFVLENVRRNEADDLGDKGTLGVRKGHLPFHASNFPGVSPEQKATKS